MFRENEIGVHPALEGSTKTNISPLERLIAMATNPVIALLRKPGNVPPEAMPSIIRSGEIQIRLRGKAEEEMADIVKISSLCCRFTNAELELHEEIENSVLLSLVTNGQTRWVSKSMKIGKKSVQVSIDRCELQNFLLAAGVMKIGK